MGRKRAVGLLYCACVSRVDDGNSPVTERGFWELFKSRAMILTAVSALSRWPRKYCARTKCVRPSGRAAEVSSIDSR